mmetsp:Transcript_24316/g.78489  ORF Transcript_24316/g.78489 Transcript_24316/m.78489 type:complete len:609 (-) Transcript_24316:271-2097(-)
MAFLRQGPSRQVLTSSNIGSTVWVPASPLPPRQQQGPLFLLSAAPLAPLQSAVSAAPQPPRRGKPSPVLAAATAGAVRYTPLVVKTASPASTVASASTVAITVASTTASTNVASATAPAGIAQIARLGAVGMMATLPQPARETRFPAGMCNRPCNAAGLGMPHWDCTISGSPPGCLPLGTAAVGAPTQGTGGPRTACGASPSSRPLVVAGLGLPWQGSSATIQRSAPPQLAVGSGAEERSAMLVAAAQEEDDFYWLASPDEFDFALPPAMLDCTADGNVIGREFGGEPFLIDIFKSEAWEAEHSELESDEEDSPRGGFAIWYAPPPPKMGNAWGGVGAAKGSGAGANEKEVQLVGEASSERDFERFWDALDLERLDPESSLSVFKLPGRPWMQDCHDGGGGRWVWECVDMSRAVDSFKRLARSLAEGGALGERTRGASLEVRPGRHSVELWVAQVDAESSLVIADKLRDVLGDMASGATFLEHGAKMAHTSTPPATFSSPAVASASHPPAPPLAGAAVRGHAVALPAQLSVVSRCTVGSPLTGYPAIAPLPTPQRFCLGPMASAAPTVRSLAGPTVAIGDRLPEVCAAVHAEVQYVGRPQMRLQMACT